MGEKLDRVFVDMKYDKNDYRNYRNGDPYLEWALHHFNKDRTMIIPIPYDNKNGRGYVRDFDDATKRYLLSRCAEKKFKVEILVHDALGKNYLAEIPKLITKYGMNKFVTAAHTSNRRLISNIFDDTPNLSCKVWLVDQDSAKLSSTRSYNPINTEMMEDTLVENEKLKKMVKEETSRREDETKRREKIERELLVLNKTVKEETNRREEETSLRKKAEKELLMLQNMVKEETSRREEETRRREEETSKREKVEKELLSMIKQAMLNEQEIRRLNEENNQLMKNKTSCTTFTIQELEQITQNFSDLLKIGEGESACVYKGNFQGTTIAIKKFKPQSKPSLSELQQKVFILTTLKHPNLVTLLGACLEPPALVYEFLSGGTLHNYLNNAVNTMPLPWHVRTRIIGEVCAGLVFLHLTKPNPLLHGFLTPENILLDVNFTSKLVNFGHVKQGETDMNNSYPAKYLAYMDPEYLTTEEVTLESDVYSFGVLILHLLTGKCRVNISKTIEKTIGNDNFGTIIDEAAGKWPLHDAEEMAKIGVWCANAQRCKRPNLVNQVKPIIERLVKTSNEIMYDPTSLGQPGR